MTEGRNPKLEPPLEKRHPDLIDLDTSGPAVTERPASAGLWKEYKPQLNSDLPHLFSILQDARGSVWNSEKSVPDPILEEAKRLFVELRPRKELRIITALGRGANGIAFLVEDIKSRAESVLKVSQPYDKERIHEPDEHLTRTEMDTANYARRLISETAVLHRLTSVEQRPMQRSGRQPPYPIMLDGAFLSCLGEDDKRWTVAVLQLEYIVGETLEQMIKLAGGTLRDQPEVVLDVSEQLMEAIAGAHRQGVWHADIKPSNLKIRNQRDVVVMDWGSSRISESRSDTTTPKEARWANPSNITYTPSYAVLPYDNDPSAERDVFAIGRTIQRMLYGRTLREAEFVSGGRATDAQLVEEMMHLFDEQETALSPQLQALSRVARAMTAIKPEDRLKLEEALTRLRSVNA